MRDRIAKMRAKWQKKKRSKRWPMPFPKLSQHIVLNSKVVAEDESE